MNKSLLLALVVTSAGLIIGETASAQNAILAEMYGRGVHAYFSGNHADANRYLTMAINNGSEDPRAYYFRGIVAQASGRSYEADADWQRGAELEAQGKINGSIGRALARFQGSGRIKLEQIRQKARLEALALAAARSQQRYGELGISGGAPAAPAPAVAAPATPPPAPAVVGNPFSDDSLAEGQPKVTADDALEGAMDNPFDEAGAGGGDASAGGEASPFGEPAGDDNPFGGDDAGGDSNPFGDDAGMDDNPFG